ncbi:DivIVA domain-containing protein [Clostridium estertheticum]|uniref:Cell division protein DivIVA n=2 Tax=Clostridium estertheticum TaxID=238834 RepID=A0A1J0GI99_9CLOT|nr:DivIVA domain-containing protein [Clostridium estertheticum]APC41106.1 cell division protein DivIVA [Clostridium estertheticum subsp. estertheticum]MBU3074111.1 DivIVA domain-containing protein [Clostridium estertheticum]MBU3164205.1 DivIVA domain-containing protein [Clostridium estertheticum]MBU3170140.1 DivIVA domain-containing protein [Clostridium estertheticum]MBU3186070.1 DivIVA domain-containing protein [Clostridium estertheticum]
MRITSMDINNKEFKKVIRGYSSEEVDDFLETVSDEYEMAYKENSTLKEKISFLEEKLNHHVKIEATIQNTLVLAQNAAEQARVSAQKEAELIIKNANDTSQRMLNKAHDDVLKVNDEYEKVKQEFAKFRTKFRSFMNCQLEMFEGLENDYLKNYNIGNVTHDDRVDDEAAIDSECSNLTLKNIEEKDFHENGEMEQIKSFFAKG